MNSNAETPQHRLSNLLHDNTNNIPEQAYIEMQKCLAEINNATATTTTTSSNRNNGYEYVRLTPTELGMGYFCLTSDDLPENYEILDQQVPLYLYNFILKVLKNRNQLGHHFADFQVHFDYNEYEVDYDFLKTELIPIFQSKGFDIRFYYYSSNVFTESNWNTNINISWDSFHLYDYMNNKTELYSKTTEEYFKFEEN